MAVGCGSVSSSSAAKSSTDQNTVVFIGSSSLQKWDLSKYFGAPHYINRGASSDQSADILARFPTDVVAAKPSVVVIWAGDNDIENNTPIETTKANISSMLKEAADAHIAVVLCTVPPKTGWQAGENSWIVSLDDWIRTQASAEVHIADLYKTLVDPSSGELAAKYAVDTEHLNAAGYAAITPVVAAQIAAAEAP